NSAAACRGPLRISPKRRGQIACSCCTATSARTCEVVVTLLAPANSKLRLNNCVLNLDPRSREPLEIRPFRTRPTIMTPRTSYRRRTSAPLSLENMTDEALLEMRFCDLPLRVEGTLLARRVVRLYRELKARDLIALPHVWLSEEFFTPEQVLGFAV